METKDFGLIKAYFYEIVWFIISKALWSWLFLC